MRTACQTAAVLVVTACKPLDYLGDCALVRGPDDLIEVTSPPWQQVYRETVRLRVETRAFAPLPVVMQTGEPCPFVSEPELTEADLTWAWPDEALADTVDLPDLAGRYVMQDTLVPDLVPGQAYPWSMKIGGTVALPGELVAPPPLGTPIRVAFVANTTQPDGALVWAAIAEADPDVVLHGGDLQARSEPGDTWSAAFHAMAPITARALLHATPGDRDHEDDELAQQWLRRFGGQGRPGSGDTYHAFDIGGVRFIGLEAAGLETSNSPQVRWLEDELGDIAASDALQLAVLFLHDDLYTLADAEPDLDARATLAEIVAGFDVPLVLSGSSLAYERFTVDDTTWIVDGGGGTGVSDVNEKVDARPADAALRVAADASLGFTLVDVDANGTLTVSRRRLDGSEADRVELPAASR